MNSARIFLSLGILTFTLSGCIAAVNPASIQARGGTTPSTEVSVASIPYDSARPTALLVVESVTSPRATPDLSNDLIVRIESTQVDLSQKLISTLTRTGNIAILDSRALRPQADGTYRVTQQDREKGPYLVRATLTEFTERAEELENSRELSLGWVGVAAGIAGLVTGKPGLGWSGLGVALADPKFSRGGMRRTGVVSFDIQVVDGRTLRVVDAFKAGGTFSAENAETSFSLFGYTDKRSAFAQSVLGQAAQAALNDAASKIRAALI